MHLAHPTKVCPGITLLQRPDWDRVAYVAAKRRGFCRCLLSIFQAAKYTQVSLIGQTDHQLLLKRVRQWVEGIDPVGIGSE